MTRRERAFHSPSLVTGSGESQDRTSNWSESSIPTLLFALAGDGFVILFRLLNLLEDLGFIIGPPTRKSSR